MIEKVNRLYRIWCNMRYRCEKEYNTHYDRYGGRGIKVCDEWSSFEVFERWARSNGYSDNLTIDRIDNNGNYEPDNCRWVDMVTQSRNKENSRMITYNGETLHIMDMAEKYNLPYGVVRARYENGWSAERIFTTPFREPFVRKVVYNGKEVTLKELSELTGVNFNTINTRYRRGCSVDELISPDKASDKLKKIFLKIDKNTGEILGRYRGSSEAVKSVSGKAKSRIIECCNGTAKTAYGYKWRYE